MPVTELRSVRPKLGAIIRVRTVIGCLLELYHEEIIVGVSAVNDDIWVHLSSVASAWQAWECAKELGVVPITIVLAVNVPAIEAILQMSRESMTDRTLVGVD